MTLKSAAVIMAEVRKAAARGLEDAAHHVMGVSNQHVPTDPGQELERSSQVTMDGLVVALSYGTDYAADQHEDLSLQHDPGRTAKYLENAMNSERHVAGAIIAAEIRRTIE